jgi:hypothetical protein
MDDNTDLPTGIPEGYALAVKELQFAIQLASNNFIVALREDNPLKAPPVLILTQELGNAIGSFCLGSPNVSSLKTVKMQSTNCVKSSCNV